MSSPCKMFCAGSSLFFCSILYTCRCVSLLFVFSSSVKANLTLHIMLFGSILVSICVIFGSNWFYMWMTISGCLFYYMSMYAFLVCISISIYISTLMEIGLHCNYKIHKSIQQWSQYYCLWESDCSSKHKKGWKYIRLYHAYAIISQVIQNSKLLSG